MRKLSGLLLIGVLLLTGCSNAPESVPEETPTETVAESDGMKFCEEMAGGMLAYTDFVSISMTDGVDMTEFAAQERYVNRLETLVPTEGKSALTLYSDMVTQIQDIVASDGTGTLSSTDFKQGSLDVMDYCIGVGYNSGF